MNKELQQKLVILLKNICNKKTKQNISLVNIDNNKELILKGVMFDDEHICYHNYEKFEDIITGLMTSADNYGIYLETEFIGIISVFYQYYKDLTRLEMAICIKKEYRNKKIGEYCFYNIIDNYFKNNNYKSIHLSIREDNIKSRKLAEKCGFKLYPGYKSCKNFIDQDGNVYPTNSNYSDWKTIGNIKGDNGADGTVFITGTVINFNVTDLTDNPDLAKYNVSSLGFTPKADDLYLNTNTYDLYKCTSFDTDSKDSIWDKVGNIKGVDGTNGNKWVAGNLYSVKDISDNFLVGAISGMEDGDFYFNTTTHEILKYTSADTRLTLISELDSNSAQ